MLNIATNRKVILCLLALGILGMFAAAVVNSINMQSLTTTHNVDFRQNSADMQELALTNEIGLSMQKLQENPDDYRELIRLSDLLVQGEQWEPAATFLRRAITIDDTQAYPFFLLGVSLHRLEKYSESAETFEKVVEINNDPVARYSLGVLYLHHLDQAGKGIEHLMAAWEDPLLDTQLKEAIEAELRKVQDAASSEE